MIKYIVELGYQKFVFETGDEAMCFASTARLSTEKGDDMPVTIELICADADEKEESEEEE